MLYVFHVETGTMMTFDMNLAMESVSSLQSVIHRGCKIPEDKQVLLVSGGESLDPAATVGKYHAGTDTNPIFLFSKSTIEAATPPSPSVNYGSDIDLQGQVEGSLLMPPAYQTVVSRAQLALQFQDVDGEELRACERLIHDQHLQQQGWAAVVANLEDVTSDLRQRFENFQEAYAQYLESRESYRITLKRVSESLQLLAKIPVLPCLNQPSDGEPACDSSTEDQEKYTLYDWISSQDANHSLHDMVEQCNKATEQLDQNVGETLRGEVDQLFKDVHNASMKEVKGLEDRLYGLDQIISGARKIVHQQSEVAQGFVHNQNRLSNVRDMSILPDLCSSHRSQLLEMLKNHAKLREIKKKCRMAKEELSVNLHTRLRWVMYVEKKICDVDGKLTIYLGNLKRLSKRLDILQQVHDAPKVYGQFVTEIVRRRQFSNKFLSWAATLADDSSQLQLDEIRRREAFIIVIGRHFLQSMFQGLEEYPPAFATEAPSPFDQNLPEITADDVKELQEAVPELSEVLSVPEDEDLFHIVSIRKDPSVEWVDHAEHSLQVPQRSNQSLLTLQPRSLGGSEVDMLYGEHAQFKSLEGGSISLGEQFTECNQEPEIVVQPVVRVMSPTDKEEFLLPQSLSEALTLEMKQTDRRKSGEFSPKLTTSEKQDQHTKSELVNLTESSVTTATEPTPERLPSIKSPLCQSPDLESLEFATADFYIDESMPSSIESPPKTCTASTEEKSIASDSSKIIDSEKVIKEKYESELKEYRRKLNKVENSMKSLQKILLETLPELKSSTLELKTEQTEVSNSFNSDVVKLKKTCETVITNFCSHIVSFNQEDLRKLQSEKDEVEMMLKDEIEAEQAKCAELRNEIEIAKKDRKDSEDSLNSKLEKARQEQNEMIEKHGREIKELIQKHELEMEVEIDKLKAELSDKHAGLEKELEKSVVTVQDKDTAIENLKKDKIISEETLMEKFQREKEKICDILSKEYEEKLNQAIKSQTEKMEQEKNVLKEELKKMHESDTQRKLEELRQGLLLEKQQEIDLTQSTMSLEHNKLTEELKNKILEEKAAEVERIKSELEIKFQEDLARFSSEFNKEKEVLVAELNNFKLKMYNVSSVQTDFSETNCDTQTGQSLILDFLSNTSMQTDVIKQSDISNQTETVEQSSFEVQTDELCPSPSPVSSNISVQTETQNSDADMIHFSSQTDKVTIEQTCTQTESQSQTQTEKETVDHSSVQTDSVTQDQSATQTEEIVSEQSRILTGSVIQGSDLDGGKSSAATSDSVSGNKSVSTTTVVQTEDSETFTSRQDYEKVIADLEAKHRQEMSDLIAKLEKEKEDSLQLRSSLTSLAGDKQVIFNEAVSRAVQAKERLIEELRNKEREMEEELRTNKEVLYKLKEEKTKAEDVKERALSLLQDKEREFSANQRRWESDLALSEQQLEQYKEQLQIMSASGSPSVVQIVDPDEPSLHQRIKDLEDTVRLKDEEIVRMEQKLMEYSMTASTRSLIQDKVSIMSCHVGDLVLLCLDERLDHYVVFTVGTTLHFLHTDCLTSLGLKPNPGETKKQWSIAEVTDKEYCQAKKPNNRFKVPVGTKFYRVKAKPWTRDSSSSSGWTTSTKPTEPTPGPS